MVYNLLLKPNSLLFGNAFFKERIEAVKFWLGQELQIILIDQILKGWIANRMTYGFTHDTDSIHNRQKLTIPMSFGNDLGFHGR